jgi:hypothetical protein
MFMKRLSLQWCWPKLTCRCREEIAAASTVHVRDTAVRPRLLHLRRGNDSKAAGDMT